MSDLIDRQKAIEAIHEDADWLAAQGSDWQVERMEREKSILMSLPSAEKAQLSGEDATFDCISRQDAVKTMYDACEDIDRESLHIDVIVDALENLPSAEPEKEVPRRVLWSGWKGTRYTRYKCPNCNKPVKNDDVHCHRCGQKLMFPHISHTPYIEGQKQELIVRWDDEE